MSEIKIRIDFLIDLLILADKNLGEANELMKDFYLLGLFDKKKPRELSKKERGKLYEAFDLASEAQSKCGDLKRGIHKLIMSSFYERVTPPKFKEKER